MVVILPSTSVFNDTANSTVVDVSIQTELILPETTPTAPQLLPVETSSRPLPLQHTCYEPSPSPHNPATSEPSNVSYESTKEQAYDEESAFHHKEVDVENFGEEDDENTVQATADFDCCGLYFASGIEYGEYLRSAKNICQECELFFTAMYRNSIT